MDLEQNSSVVAIDFAEEVQKYDCLYNKNNKDYKNKNTKQNCWTKVGEKFDMTAAEAEKRFKNIRTAYGRYLKKVKNIPSGSGRDAVPVPREFENLGWLSSYITSRTSVSNLKSLTRIDEDSDTELNPGADNCDEFQQDEAGNINTNVAENSQGDDAVIELGINSSSPNSPLSLTQSTSTPSTDKSGSSTNQNTPTGPSQRAKAWAKGNKKLAKEDVDAALLKTANSLAESLKTRMDGEKRKHQGEDDADEDSLFCRSLAPRLKRLPQRAKYFARMQIEQILFKAEFESSEVPNPRQTLNHPGAGAMGYPQGTSAAPHSDYGFIPRGEPSSFLDFLHSGN